METVTLKQALELVRGNKFESEATSLLESMADVLPIHVHAERLEVDKLHVEGIVVHAGGLHVRGLLEGAPTSHGTMLIVLGDLDAEDVIFHGPMIVTGDMRVRRTAYFDSCGDFGLFVGGKLEATVLVEHEHGLTVSGGLASTHVHRGGGDPRALFVDEVLAEQRPCWRVDPALMKTAIREGRTFLRGVPASA